MFKKFKSIVAKIIIAQKKNKKILKITYYKSYEKILNLLWDQGFIYGYSNKANLYYVIFLKYSEQGLILFKRIKFYKKLITFKKLRVLYFLDKNYTYFLLNDKGFFCQKTVLKAGMGGIIFIKA